ncbi:uncharacterized protein LOC126799954 [Argentina anserina]|uniref:uncharacterized protein LOC126799954 n=1 Tax=Argentina anserina TaxID=57926 RepID=UPI002176256E|nr:uncharacterized protein LOC126799954 [Potentilla anserina]
MALKIPAAMAVLLLIMVLISGSNFASAASGGQSGGRLFRSGRVSSSSSYSSRSSGSSGSRPQSKVEVEVELMTAVLFIVALAIVYIGVYPCMGFGNPSVVKLQVGLMGKAQSLQKDLNQLTETTDMSTAEGLSRLLAGASSSLRRNLDHCISSYSSVTPKSYMEDAEQCFKRLSMEEAAKFDEVTLYNVNNCFVKSTNQSPNEVHKEYIVVTLLVCAREVQKLPTINGLDDLKKALQSLGSITSNKILAVEVLWTPQQENDTLTEKELLKNYPQLRGFYDPGSLQESSYDESQPFLGATVVEG